eukprot:scaffold104559_cov60-Phaeocystis_antarctica.AAC.1
MQQQRYTLTATLARRHSALHQRPPLARRRLPHSLALAAEVPHGEQRAWRVGAQRLGQHEQPLLRLCGAASAGLLLLAQPTALRLHPAHLALQPRTLRQPLPRARLHLAVVPLHLALESHQALRKLGGGARRGACARLLLPQRLVRLVRHARRVLPRGALLRCLGLCLGERPDLRAQLLLERPHLALQLGVAPLELGAAAPLELQRRPHGLLAAIRQRRLGQSPHGLELRERFPLLREPELSVLVLKLEEKRLGGLGAEDLGHPAGVHATAPARRSRCAQPNDT